MKQDKQDRRSRRTRQLVTTAMMDLLLERRYDAITVQDILERAGIGRSTFYAHYFDKEDVLASVVEQMLATFRHDLSDRAGGQEIIPSLELFRHVYEHPRRENFQAMMRGHAGELLRETTQATLSKTIEEALASARPEKLPTTIPLPVVAQYLAGAFLNLFYWWLGAGMPYPPEQMNRIFEQLALPGVRASIKST